MSEENSTRITEIWITGFQNLQEFRIVLFIVILIVYIMILTGNLLIVVLVLTFNQLHSPMYFFLSSLSSSEIIFTTNIIPNFLHVILAQGDSMSVTECFIQLYVCASSAATECLLLTVMSYDRYLAICHPLHYSSIMKIRMCLQMIIWSWIIGFCFMLTPLILICQLHLCDFNVIDHFFCDFDPIIELSCFDTSDIKSKNLIFSSLITLFPFTFIIGTYIFIIIAILKIPSTSGKQKAFLTCSSHLTVVSTYFSTLFVVYVIPIKGYSNTMHKILSLMYCVVTPFLNPLIYSLKNRDIRDVLQKLTTTVKAHIG